MAETLPLLEINPQEVQVCTPVTVAPCATCDKVNIGNVGVTNGFILEVNGTITNACRGRTLSVAAILCETVNNTDIVRGVQVIEVPVPTGTGRCTNVPVSFVFAFSDICRDNNRTFRARIIAHYLNPAGCTCPCPRPTA